MDISWFVDAFSFAFLDTTVGVVGSVTLYVFAKLVLESRK